MGLLGKLWNRKAQVDEANGLGVSYEVPTAHQPYEWRSEHVTASPDRDLPLLCSSKTYSCARETRRERSSGIVQEMGLTYYGDAQSADELWLDVLEVEGLVNSVGVRGVFRTDPSLVCPLPVGVIPHPGQGGLICISVNPPTKTGKPPRNVVSVLLDATRNGDGAIWHIDYLADGSVNKADVHYWNRGVRHTFHVRRKKVGLAVTYACTSDREGDEVPLYRYEE